MSNRLPFEYPGATRKSAGGILQAFAIAPAVLALLAGGLTPQDLQSRTRTAGDGWRLPEAAKSAVSAALGSEDPRYRTSSDGVAQRMDNPAQFLHADFMQDGINLSTGAAHWQMAMIAFGYEGSLQTATPARPEAHGNRVEYQRSGVTEWYVNGPAGLEQGFTISQKPSQAGKSETLVIALSLSGGSGFGRVERDGSTRLLLRDAEGTARLRYNGLIAWDADGRELSSRMEVTRGELRLLVDASAARYPVVVDPYLQQAKLTTSDGQANESAGYAISMSGDGTTIVAGAPGYQSNAGAAYIFTKPGAFWGNATEIAKLTPQDSAANNQFGVAVSISSDGGTIAVGQHASAANSSGAVYVYVKPAGGWVSVAKSDAKLTPGDEHGDFFGASVSLSQDGSSLAVGAPSSSNSRGAVYVYAKPAAGWPGASQFTAKLTNQEGGALGTSVAISYDGTVIAAGAPGATLSSLVSTGIAYVFVRHAGTWVSSQSPNAYLNTSDANEYDSLGTAVAMSGDGKTVVATTSNYSTGVGAAYVFIKHNVWAGQEQFAKLTAPAALGFGISAAINSDGSVILVGADKTNGQGVAALFSRPGTSWASTAAYAELSDSDLPGAPRFFGFSVSLDAAGVSAAAGAFTALGGTNQESGAAYVFQLAAPATPSTTSLTFGTQQVNTSSTQPVTLTNNGPADGAPLHITGVTAPSPFHTTSNCAAASPLAVGTSCTDMVTFAPTGDGPAAGTLQFSVDSGEINVSLGGTGVGGQYATRSGIDSTSPGSPLAGQPITINFAVEGENIKTLFPSGSATVTASNGQSCTGSLTPYTQPNSTSDSFATGACSITFASGGTYTLTVVYPGDANFAGSTSLAVTEPIEDFSLAVSPATGVTAAYQPVNFAITLNPITGFNGAVTLSCATTVPGAYCVVPPTPVMMPMMVGGAVTTNLPVMVSIEGSGTVTYTATYGNLNRSATATLTVQ